MSPLNKAYTISRLQLLTKMVSEEKVSDKEISRELARLADEADKDAGLILLQEFQIERSALK